MLSVIGHSAVCMHGPGHHLDPLVWFDPLANTSHLVNPRNVHSRGARKRMSGSWSSLPSYGGSEGDNTHIPPVATEEPVVSSSCSKNKHLLSTSIGSDQCRGLLRDTRRRRVLKKLAVLYQPSRKHIHTQVLQPEERML